MKINKVKTTAFCDNIIFFSVCAVAFFLPISKAIIGTFIYISIFFWLIKKITNRSLPEATPINLAVIIYLLFCLFSVFVSSNPKISWGSFLGKVLQNTAFFLVVSEAFNSKKKFKVLIWVLFFSLVLLSADGLFQYFTHKDFLRNRPAMFFNRMYASFGTPNSFGCYLISLIPFVLLQSFAKFNSNKHKIAFGALSIVLFSCLMLTVSRGAWFGFIGSVLFISMWVPALWIVLCSLGLLILFASPLYESFLKQRLANFFSFDDLSGQDRRVMWQAGWSMFKAGPWFGLGIGTFMFNFKEYVADKTHYISYAHNCYLQIAAEIGLVGLSVFLAIVGLFFYNGIRTLRRADKDEFWYILLASLAAILAYCIQMVVDTIFYSLDLGVLFWLVLGIGAAAISNIKRSLKTL